VLSSCFLSSLLQVQLFNNALCMQCILWCESVNIFYETRVWAWFEVWVFFVRCEHVRLKVSLWGQSLRLKVWGWSSKVWNLKYLCQIEGLRCEARCEIKGLRLEVWNWRLKVWSIRYMCQVGGLKATVWNVKLFVKGWRYLCARSEVRGLTKLEV
jgi:hypothetical protein